MDLNAYQLKSKKSAAYSSFGAGYVYPALGLASEAGEVAGKIKKAIRDNNGLVDKARKEDIKEELGDEMWYVAQLATDLGLTLDEIARANIEKLYSRLERGKIQGDGDNR